jgi:hypothetical protein
MNVFTVPFNIGRCHLLRRQNAPKSLSAFCTLDEAVQ